MDSFRQNIALLQDSLWNLKLQPLGEGDRVRVCPEQLLLGKLLATRSFRRFIITEIVERTWKTSSRVQISKIGDNIFKFTFGSREDKEMIFNGRPWSFNGAYIILKECSNELSLKEISFDTSTFTIQVHELPLAFIHASIAEKIRSMIGILHRDSLNKRCVVANSYLRFRVDIKANHPIPAGFFQDRQGWDEI